MAPNAVPFLLFACFFRTFGNVLKLHSYRKANWVNVICASRFSRLIFHVHERAGLPDIGFVALESTE